MQDKKKLIESMENLIRYPYYHPATSDPPAKTNSKYSKRSPSQIFARSYPIWKTQIKVSFSLSKHYAKLLSPSSLSFSATMSPSSNDSARFSIFFHILPKSTIIHADRALQQVPQGYCRRSYGFTSSGETAQRSIVAE